MKVLINGGYEELDDQATIASVLSTIGIQETRGVAVAVDSEVIPRTDWDSRRLTEGQKIEVLRAVQGG